MNDTLSVICKCDGKKHYFIYFFCRFGNTEETSSQYINFKQPLFLINLHTAVLVSVFLSLHFVCAFSKLISLVNGLLVTFHFYLCCCVSSLIIARRYRTFKLFSQSYQTLENQRNVHSSVTLFTRINVFFIPWIHFGRCECSLCTLFRTARFLVVRLFISVHVF